MEICEKSILRYVTLILLLLAFNAHVLPNLHLGVENAVEAGFLWTDEGRQIRNLEQMQAQQTLKLNQVAYTALYVNLSYGLGWILEGGTPISAKSFAYGSRLVSLVAMNAFLLLCFGVAWRWFRSGPWAIVATILMAGQSLNLQFATKIHPEALMVLWVMVTLWGATVFLGSGKLWHLWVMVLGSALAVGTKPIVLFLLPWQLLVFGAALWLHRIRSFPVIWGMALSALLVFALGFTAASPYQAFHLLDWIQGLLSENAYSVGKYDLSSWYWFKIITDVRFLGPLFSAGLIFGLIAGTHHLYRSWKSITFQSAGVQPANLQSVDAQSVDAQSVDAQSVDAQSVDAQSVDAQSVDAQSTSSQMSDSRSEFLRKPLNLFFCVNVSWVVMGSGYILLKSHSFIHRYLMHVHVACLWILVLGMYWWWEKRSTRHKKWILPIGIVLLWGGIQPQWRESLRDLERRQKIMSQMPAHRAFYQELRQMIPSDAKLLYTRQVYLLPQDFPNALRAIPSHNLRFLEEADIEYLVVNRKGRPGLKMEGKLPNNEWGRNVEAGIQFWKDLEADQVNGAFKILKTYPHLKITLYQKSR